MTSTRTPLLVSLVTILLPGCEPQPVDITADGEAPIIGGELDSDDLYPEVVAIYFHVSMFEGGLCTGTVIHDEWVLTAAHCPIDGYSMTMSKVYFGPDMLDAEVEMGFDEVWIHEDYDDLWGIPINDVALLHLEETSPVEPIPIHREVLGGEVVGEQATFVGFGLHEETADAEIDGLKRYVDIEVAEVYPFDADVFYYQDPSRGTAQGDSGGPALFDFGEGPRVIGVTSWGFGEYGVSMAVPSMADWVDGYTGGDSEPWGDDDDTAAGDDDTAADDDVETDDDDDTDEGEGGCACDASGTPAPFLGLAALLLLALRCRAR